MPCKIYQPVLVELKHEGMNIDFINIEADENREKVLNSKISSIPITIIYKDGKEWERLVGSQSKEQIKYFMSE